MKKNYHKGNIILFFYIKCNKWHGKRIKMV